MIYLECCKTRYLHDVEVFLATRKGYYSTFCDKVCTGNLIKFPNMLHDVRLDL